MEREGLRGALRWVTGVLAAAALATACGLPAAGVAPAAAAPVNAARAGIARTAKNAQKPKPSKRKGAGTKAPKRKGAAKITGALESGQTLTVVTGTWKGTPPLSFTYQWEACDATAANCSEINGATGASYQIASSLEGARLRALITAAGPGGSATSTSKPTKPIGPGPPVNTAAPVVSGSLQEGQTLTADTGTWGGTAPFEFSYQWLRCSVLASGCEEIPGATSSTYTLGALDLASQLAVVVSASNRRGSASATSAETSPILALLPSNTLPPSISGTLRDGQLLSVTTGSWSGSEPISHSYQWQLCSPLGEECEEIRGATGATFGLSAGDIGRTLDALVTATNAGGSTVATTPVTGLIEGLLPVNSVLPSITGLLKEGGLLNVGTGSWSGSEPISYSYQWQLCNQMGEACSNMSEATGSSLKLTALDIGKTLDVVVKATNVAGSTSVTTSLTSLIEGLLPVNNVLPSITGLLKEGGLLSVGTGSWSGSEPVSYSYQWQLCNASGEACGNISEATGSSLKLTSLDIGKTLDVVVKATSIAGSTSVTTSLTGLIEGLLPVNTVLPSITGLLKEGGLLSVGTGSWSGTEPIAYSYQWQLCNPLGEACSDISEATGSSLKPSSSDIGKTLDAVVTATNPVGSTSVTSSLTGLIEGLLPVNNVLPSIAGTLLEGKSLTAASGSWSGTAPISYSYQWQLCPLGEACRNISEATASVLSLLAPYVGDSVDVVVKASNVAGSTTATSPVSSPISGIAPLNTALPVISGLLEVGKALSVSNGSWSGTTPMSFKYQWQLCLLGTCTNIGGATGATLTLLGIDIGDTLDAIVTATNVSGSSSATSKPTEKLLGIL
ncbi:MAG TPA: hypothetical protein VK721_16440 [Solirubrobacteraceae bacterium]|nr:hypothetical protein [Solirubrobacteraceae bacterium]